MENRNLLEKITNCCGYKIATGVFWLGCFHLVGVFFLVCFILFSFDFNVLQ